MEHSQHPQFCMGVWGPQTARDLNAGARVALRWDIDSRGVKELTGKMGAGGSSPVRGARGPARASQNLISGFKSRQEVCHIL